MERLQAAGKVGMSTFALGDIVVLTAGSMRMAVEGVDGEMVACVWCHEGQIGRDSFNTRLLKKWEYREDTGHRGSDRGGDRGADRAGDRAGSGKPWGGDREGGGKPYGKSAPRANEKPDRNTGWDGKPREKKHFRKDG